MNLLDSAFAAIVRKDPVGLAKALGEMEEAMAGYTKIQELDDCDFTDYVTEVFEFLKERFDWEGGYREYQLDDGGYALFVIPWPGSFNMKLVLVEKVLEGDVVTKTMRVTADRDRMLANIYSWIKNNT